MTRLPPPVYRVSLPVNSPFTGRYALFQPPGETKYPNFEDHVLIRRVHDLVFEPILVTFVPFDEEPMRLWDNPAQPLQIVIYHRFFIAYSIDGGDTFRQPSPQQQAAIGCGVEGRWSSTAVLNVRMEAAQLLVDTSPWSRSLFAPPPSEDSQATTWSLPIDSDAEPSRIESHVRPIIERQFLPGFQRDDTASLLRADRTHLFARSALTDDFQPVDLMALTYQDLAQNDKMDFFGGSAGRSFF